uniref:Band 7 domain-containing protein n=1 Tax=Meloidogyne floridensis TaxID=298350 RepID=A0A915P820_9BILA
MSIKVVQEYERAVIFRLGRLLPGGAKGPGIFFIVPCIDTYRKVDLRVLSFEVPPQEILSKDSVTVAVDAVVYFRISNATISVTNVEDASRSTKLLAQTTLRNILGTKTLAEMLSDREAISLQMQATLDEATEPWGVKVERVEVKDVRLPIQLQRAMAAEAEAAREARAKVIVAEGEQKASRALKEAADVIAESPQAIQLRYLQTLNSISAEKNSTIIFPFPVDLLSALLHQQQHSSTQQPSLSTQNQQQQQTQIQPINRSPVHKTNVFSTVVAPASQQYQMKSLKIKKQKVVKKKSASNSKKKQKSTYYVDGARAIGMLRECEKRCEVTIEKARHNYVRVMDKAYEDARREIAEFKKKREEQHQKFVIRLQKEELDYAAILENKNRAKLREIDKMVTKNRDNVIDDIMKVVLKIQPLMHYNSLAFLPNPPHRVQHQVQPLLVQNCL